MGKLRNETLLGGQLIGGRVLRKRENITQRPADQPLTKPPLKSEAISTKRNLRLQRKNSQTGTITSNRSKGDKAEESIGKVSEASAFALLDQRSAQTKTTNAPQTNTGKRAKLVNKKSAIQEVLSCDDADQKDSKLRTKPSNESQKKTINVKRTKLPNTRSAIKKDIVDKEADGGSKAQNKATSEPHKQNSRGANLANNASAIEQVLSCEDADKTLKLQKKPSNESLKEMIIRVKRTKLANTRSAVEQNLIGKENDNRDPKAANEQEKKNSRAKIANLANNSNAIKKILFYENDYNEGPIDASNSRRNNDIDKPNTSRNQPHANKFFHRPVKTVDIRKEESQPIITRTSRGLRRSAIFDFRIEERKSRMGISDPNADIIRKMISEGKVSVATSRKGTGKTVLKRSQPVKIVKRVIKKSAKQRSKVPMKQTLPELNNNNNSGSSFSNLARNVLLQETQKVNYQTRNEQKKHLIEAAKKFVSTPLHGQRQAQPEPFISPIPLVQPQTTQQHKQNHSMCLFNLNSMGSPSFPSDHLSSTQRISPPNRASSQIKPIPSNLPVFSSTSSASFSSNDSNGENVPPPSVVTEKSSAAQGINVELMPNRRQLPNPNFAQKNRSPLKAIQILEVVDLQPWKELEKNSEVQMKKRIIEDSGDIGKEFPESDDDNDGNIDNEESSLPTHSNNVEADKELNLFVDHESAFQGQTVRRTYGKNVPLQDTQKVYSETRNKQNRFLIEVAKKFVSTPLHGERQAQTEPFVSPIPSNQSMWRVSGGSVLPSSFQFNLNSMGLPSFSSDHIASTPRKLKPRSVEAGKNSSALNRRQLPDLKFAQKNASPLKAIQILEVIDLPPWKELDKNTEQQVEKLINDDSGDIGKERLFGFDEFLESDEDNDGNIDNDESSLPTPSNTKQSKDSLAQKLESLKKWLPHSNNNDNVSTTNSQKKLPRIFDDNDVGKQKTIKHMLSSTLLKSPSMTKETDKELNLFADPEPESAFQGQTVRRTYVQPFKRKRKRQTLLLFPEHHESSDDEEGGNGASTVPAVAEKSPSPHKKRGRVEPAKNKELAKYVKQFNSICDEVDRYELIVE